MNHDRQCYVGRQCALVAVLEHEAKVANYLDGITKVSQQLEHLSCNTEIQNKMAS